MSYSKQIHQRLISILVAACLLLSIAGCSSEAKGASQEPASSDTPMNIKVAVEYTDHAAAYYYAQEADLFSEAGLEIDSVKVYASGVAVAAALTKEDFDVSYMCLVPAIFAYANGDVPLKIIAGTHKNGYALVVNSAAIDSIEDLERDGITIANGPQGTSTDFLQMLLIEKEGLDGEKIKANTVRMNAAKQLMALYSGQVDAVFVPEHFATLAASFPGMTTLVRSQDIWPEMQGSLLVVTEDMVSNQPEVVEKLRQVNQESLRIINDDPQTAASLIAECLCINQSIVQQETKTPDIDLTVDGELIAESMSYMTMTSDITVEEIQAVIDKMYAFGYIEAPFDADEILALE